MEIKNIANVKIVSEHTWKIVASCKGFGINVDRNKDMEPIQVVQEYLKEEYLNNDFYLKPCELYNFLLEAAIELFDKNEFENILRYDIKNLFNMKTINQLEPKIDYEDLCNLLITKIILKDVRDKKENEYYDLIAICSKDGQIYDIDSFEDIWRNNKKLEKRKTK